MKKLTVQFIGLFLLVALAGLVSAAATDSRGAEHGQRSDRLVICNVLVIDGKGMPTLMRDIKDMVAAARGAMSAKTR
jgi:hypothetical protein